MDNLISGILMATPSGLWEKIIMGLEGGLGAFSLSIIILTIIIKLVMSPIDFFNKRTNKKMSMMQAKIQPQIDAIQKKYAKDEKLKNQKVACVYLTGGASRMDFVREIFMKVFNLKADQCPSDDNPSLIVSQGVAHLSYADYKTQEKEKELREKAKKIIDSFDWEGKIKEIVYSSVKQSIIDKAKSIMLSYQNGKIYDMHTVKDGVENGIKYGYGLAAYKDKDKGYWFSVIMGSRIW